MGFASLYPSYELYRNSELRHISRHPGPRRGAIVRRNERGSGCGGRGCDGHAKAGPGRDEPREVLGCVRNGRRQCPVRPFGSKQGGCVRRKRVVLTVVATVQPCGDESGLNRVARHRQFAR